MINPSNNSVLIEAGKGEISGLLNRELTVYRESWTGTEAVEKAASGLYHVSVIVKKRAAIANNDTVVMYVDVKTNHPADSTIDVLQQFELTGRSFFNAAGDTITAPIEVNLGHIEVRETTDGVTYIVQRGTNPAWTDVGLHKKARSMNTDFDVRIRPGNGDAQLLLDAVCLTDPNAFGLFAPSVLGVIAEHAGKRDSVTRRFAEILNDDGARTQFPNLRYIAAPEVGLFAGTWATISFGQTLLKQMAGETVTLYAATGYSENPLYSGAFNRRFASGYYGYPIRSEYPRPTLVATEPWTYHQNLHRVWIRGFAELAFRYNNHAQNRGQYGSLSTAWLPYVQNHSNRFSSDIPEWDDADSLREPTASELRSQCNIALAHGADGVMFYQYISSPWTTDEPFWPPDTTAWKADTAGGGARELDPNMGNLGFLDEHLLPRTCDWNGENKFDSTKAYIHSFLAPVGNLVKTSLEWQSSKLWCLRDDPYGGSNAQIATVVSRRQDMPNPVDIPDSTFVLVSEFKHRGDGSLYLLVVNTRTHPREGHRHITVKLSPNAGSYDQWKVTNVQTGDIWIVRPNAAPDTTSTANGFTEYFAPGRAALYRLESFADETLDFDGSCLSGSLYIEPEAALHTKSTDDLRFPAGKGIFCDGSLGVFSSTYTSCDAEQRWLGIHARNQGFVSLSGATISNAEVAVAVGSEANAYLDDCAIVNPGSAALANLGGHLYSASTQALSCESGYLSSAGYYSMLSHDEATKTAASSPWDVGIFQTEFGFTSIDHSRITDFSVGIMSLGGTVTGDGWNPAYNHIDARDNILGSELNGHIDFGNSAGTDGTMNCFILQNSATGTSANGNGQGILAAGSFWDPQPPILVGSVNASDPLSVCPVPFAYEREAFSKSNAVNTPVAASPLRQAFRDSNYTLLRRLIVSALSSTTSPISRMDLDLLRLRVLPLAGFEDLRDTLVMHLLSLPDLRSKLFAADVLAEARRHNEAYEILQAWSFITSTELHSSSLLRKALFAPRAVQGGYSIGRMAMDTLRTLAGSGVRWQPFFDLYPRLYSSLTHARYDSSASKTARRESILDRVIPSTIEMGQNYPNPFSAVTSFTFKLPDTREVKLTVHDMLGREVAVVKEGMLDRGIHSAVLHAGRLSAGMYLYRLQAGTEVLQGRMVLVR